MELLKHGLEFRRDRQAQVRSVFYERNAFGRDIEKDDCGSSDAAGSDDLRIENMSNADQQEDQHLPADALKAHGA